MLTGRYGQLAAGLGAALCFAAGAAKADKAAQPVATPSFSWTGFYVGAQMGGLADLGEVSDPLGPSLFGNPNLATGPFAGGQVGYNYQSGMVVYGLETEVNFPEVRGNSTCSALSGSFINSSCKIGLDAFGALTGRIGLALGPNGRSLIYVKSGAAWAVGSIDMATNDFRLGANGNPFTRGSNDVSRWGWTLGAGAEYALPGNWSVKAEYDYANLGDQSVTLLPSANLSAAGAVTSSVPARQGRVSDEMHLFKLGVNYRFGEPAPPSHDGTKLALLNAPAPLNAFGLELGGRYWYSWGRHKEDLGNFKSTGALSYSLISRLTYDDLDASTGEVTGRITAPWNLFAKGFIGGGSISGGHMNDEDFNIAEKINNTNTLIPYTNTISSKVTGYIPAYGTIDVGYDWWRTPSYRVGTYVGYNYYGETMGAYGCAQTANALGPCGPGNDGPRPPTGHAIITEDAIWQSLRLGAAVEFKLAPRVRLSGDAAYLPYVTVNAEDHHYSGSTIASVNPGDGTGVGTQLEAMLYYDVTERISLGVGARYWAMWTTRGNALRTYNSDPENPITLPLPHQYQGLNSERAGVLAQVLYKFD